MSSSTRSQAWKWWIAVVLFLATVLTYLDRQTLSICASRICEEMQLNDKQYGYLVAAFRWAYALMHVAAGLLADRAPLRRVYALAVLVWSAAGASVAFVQHYGALLCARAVLGMGEAFNWPCATRIVANLLPPEDRPFASGIFNSGAAVGSFVAPLLIAPLAFRFGWRTAFAVVGGLGLVWIAIWLATTRGRGELGGSRPASGSARQPPAVRMGLGGWKTFGRQVLLRPGFWLMLLVGLSANPCWYFLNDWVPKYLHDQRHLDFVVAATSTLPIFLAADLGNLVGGGLVKLLTLRGWPLRRARGAIVTLAAALIVPTAGLTHVQSVPLAVALLACAAAGLNAILANYTACQQDLSAAHVGLVAGLLGMACNVASATVNPWIGDYVDRTGSYHLVFVLLGLLPLAALAAMLSFERFISQKGVAP